MEDAEALVNISIDLVEETRHHLAFLQTIWEHQELFQYQTLTFALKRYAELWLPLAGAREREDVEPPLDVHWVWYLHMLKPHAYNEDCMKLIGKVPSHKLHFLSESRDSARERTKILWEKRFPKEAFDIPTEEYKSMNLAPQVSHLTHIITDVKTQKMYIYQMLLPHYSDVKFQQTAVERYKRYLYTRKASPEYTSPPSSAGFDVDLMHRTHKIRPQEYSQDIMAVFNMMPDLESNAVPNSPVTAQPHLPTIGEDQNIVPTMIKVPGAMFRGEPPLSKLFNIKYEDIYEFSHKGCDLGIKKIRIENISYKNIAVIIGIARWSSLEITNHEFKSSGNPPFEWIALRNDEDLACLEWKTEGYEQFYISAYRRKFHKGKKSKALVGCLFDKQLLECIENSEVNEDRVTKNFAKTVAGHNCEVRFVVTTQVRDIKRLSVEFSLRRGDFEKRLLPENIREIWGPLMLQKLPPKMMNQCAFALHR